MNTFSRFRLVHPAAIRLLAVLLATTAAALGQPGPDADYPANKAAAEQFYAEGSYAKANDIYAKVDLARLSPDEARWVTFRSADTQWRAQAATDNADTTRLDAVRDSLEKQVRDLVREDQHDRLWVEVQESLGDFFWTRRNNNNWYNDWNGAWPHYEAALDWWAGQSDLELARERYLKIVWRMSQTPDGSGLNYYWGNRVPLEVLENAVKTARSEDDQAHAHYLVASWLRNQGGDWEQRARVPEEFAAAIKPGKKTAWYDDALFNYAQWLEQNGRTVHDQNGNWSTQPDYVTALELFRRLTGEFQKGESRYWDQARQEIENITGPQVTVGVANIFLPGSEFQYYLDWRNVKKIQLALYPVDLNRAVNFPAASKERSDWLQSIDLGALEKIKSWTRETHDAGVYQPSNEVVRLDEKLPPGAYVIEARAGGISSRQLILVSDAALVLKSSGRQALVYLCNALDGSPLAAGHVKLWQCWWEHDQWHARSETRDSDTNGLAVFDLPAPHSNVELFASATRDDRQAFCLNNSYWYGDNGGRDQWRIYAFTDRPAYRPQETVDWKFIARRYDGTVYSTPANETIEYEITDPRGTKVKADKIKLNEFGSAWGALDMTDKMPLGEYRVEFWDDGRHNEIGSATLFRLEEYKLPEFKVSVTTPEENGRKKTFRLGETVAATIQADYYFGGPVADADVTVLVHQKIFWHSWHEPRDYTWYYEDMDNGNSPYGRWRGGYGGDQIITNATLKTDATGKATLTFATQNNTGQDFEYAIEARVTDASRREITGNGTVRVTRQRYYVYARPAHNLYRPQDKVTVAFKALDANDQPVPAAGKVTVTRDYWYEIWLAPDGHEVKGDELKHLEAANKIWPPAPARPDQKDWRLKFRGYEHQDILTQNLQTDTNGAAELTFTPEREGYYRVAWSGEDVFTNQPPQPINADTTVWVAKNSTTELGYRTGGVEIIADQDTFRAGGVAPVMLVAPATGRYVLFTVEGEDLYHYQLVHLDGTVKLVNLAVDEKYVPNVFLNATLVNDRVIFTDTKQIVVPPVKNFLNVEVKPDRGQYQPRDEGTLTVTTKNDEGRPVSAEVALSLADESVFYIQNDYAGDPRQFYFGTKRSQQIQTQATMNQKSYARLVEWENHQLIDDRQKERLEAARREQPEQLKKDGRFAWKTGGSGGGGGGGGMIEDGLDEDAETDTSGGGGFGGGGIGGAGGVRYMAAYSGLSSIDAGMPMLSPPGRVPYLHGIPVTGDLMQAELPTGGFPSKSAHAHPTVVVRSDFRSTVFWQPDVVTDKNGQATVKVKYPDSLTSWRATARAVTAVNQFGIADATTRTRQPLIVRLEAPRFFVVGDTVTISAVVNNNTESEMTVQPGLEPGGILSDLRLEPAAPLKVPANGEARADWVLKISQPGDVKLKVTAHGGDYADAMEKTITAYEHGIEKFISKSGKARGGDVTVNLVLPHDRKPDSTSLTIQVTPSLAVTMLDALPYLINYPYGCTEQTLSRFLPTVITAKTLRDAGLQPGDVLGRVFGGIETNSAAATHPDGKKNLEDMEKMTQAGLDRLYDFQHDDGGWGWWKAGDSDHWMTAYVVWGLSLARDAGVEIKEDVLRRGAKYLDEHLVEEENNYDQQAFMLYALAANHAVSEKTKDGPGDFQTKAFINLYVNRDQLNAYTRALLALSAHSFGKTNEAQILIANLENGVVRDDRPDQSVLVGGAPQTNAEVMGTAHWGNDGIYWRWSEGGVEATAFALRALLAVDPTNALVEPVANWLIKNRRGAQWNNTRDTAIVVLALNDYLRASGELHPDADYEVDVNGTKVAARKISGADVFNAPSNFTIDPNLIQDTNEIRIVSHGDDGRVPALYFSANAKFFSTEEPVAPAGNEIFVKREYYKLVGRPTLLKGYVYDREPLRDGETVTSGDRVETVLTIEAKNDYEYLLFEDLKPAGFEAAEIRSGEDLEARELKAGNDANGYTGRTRWVYQELRDRQVALFIDHLPQGVWQVRYDFRAETPGQFHALPVLGQAMYVPEIRCNSAELRITVVDKTP
jgi:alpha-2-macroglobulin